RGWSRSAVTMTRASRRCVEQLDVRGSGQSDLMGVDGVMTDDAEMGDSQRRHWDVVQELQPVRSMVSSSARLAAYRRASSMSAASRYGQARRMSSRLWQWASNPSRRETEKRRSRMQGFSVQTSGRVVIRVKIMATSPVYLEAGAVDSWVHR